MVSNIQSKVTSCYPSQESHHFVKDITLVRNLKIEKEEKTPMRKKKKTDTRPPNSPPSPPLPLQPEGLRVLRVRASPPQHHPLQEGQGDDQGGVLDGVFVCAVPERPGVELRPYVRWV